MEARAKDSLEFADWTTRFVSNPHDRVAGHITGWLDLNQRLWVRRAMAGAMVPNSSNHALMGRGVEEHPLGSGWS